MSPRTLLMLVTLSMLVVALPGSAEAGIKYVDCDGDFGVTAEDGVDSPCVVDVLGPLNDAGPWI